MRFGCVIFRGKRNRNIVVTVTQLLLTDPSVPDNSVHSLASFVEISSSICSTWRLCCSRVRTSFCQRSENHQSELADIKFAICRLITIIIIMHSQRAHSRKRYAQLTPRTLSKLTECTFLSSFFLLLFVVLCVCFDPMCCVRDKCTHYTSPEREKSARSMRCGRPKWISFWMACRLLRRQRRRWWHKKQIATQENNLTSKNSDLEMRHSKQPKPQQQQQPIIYEFLTIDAHRCIARIVSHTHSVVAVICHKNRSIFDCLFGWQFLYLLIYYY